MSDQDNDTVQFSGRLPTKIVEEIEEIASHLYAPKTAILKECLRIGLEEFKKLRPDIIKLVENRQKDSAKKGDHKKAG